MKDRWNGLVPFRLSFLGLPDLPAGLVGPAQPAYSPTSAALPGAAASAAASIRPSAQPD